MKRILFLIMSAFSMLNGYSADNLYVIKKDGSVESYPTNKVDSISFDDPHIEKVVGFSDVAEKVIALENELDKLNEKCASKNASVLGKVDGYEFVDLGLPSGLKWATRNIGAEAESDFGTYFALGEVAPSKTEVYSDKTYKFSGKSLDDLKSMGVIDENGNLTAKYDAATQNWSENWRMPTKDDFKELLEYCTWTWTTLNEESGFMVVSKKQGSAGWIFFPTTGYFSNTFVKEPGAIGEYWSSSFSEDSSYTAYVLEFTSSDKSVDDDISCYGLTIRPVTK
ncbi:MAG: hypothetical protein MJZ19_09075 [Paludibacteraceae bacterium]|nr:hypothetical protein [Paludibacteraceae bacterium]